MLADAHRKAAEDIESAILSLQAQPRAARVVIEGQSAVFFTHLAGMGPGLHRQCEARWQNPLSARRASYSFRRLKHPTVMPTRNIE